MAAYDSIEMVHPGPVRLVKRGARKDVVALAPMRTRVGIREVEACEIPKVAILNDLGSYHSYHAFEGGLWLRAEGIRFGKLPAKPSAEDFVSFLGDAMPAERYAGTDYARALTGTPLLGQIRREVRSLDKPDVADDAREILDDARDEAVAAARRWASERVLFAGGNVYLRAPGPMAILGERGRIGSLQRCLVTPFAAHWRTAEFRSPDFPDLALELQGFPVRVDRIADMQAAVEPFGLVSNARGQLQIASGQASGIPADLFGDDDLSLMANVLPGYALGEIARLGREPEEGSDNGALAAARALLKPLETRGTVGIFDADAAEDVIGCVAAVARQSQSVRFQAIALWADKVALPRLRERNLRRSPPEDEAALSGLTP